jgi:hypothetical protein
MKETKNTITVKLGKIKNTCFVVMPFDSLFQNQYETVIKKAVEELGFECIRGDEIYSKPTIMADIWKSIRSARFIIAEMTGKNENVFYEVGLAHAIGKPIIIITRNEDDVPFDLKALRYLYYDINDPHWGDNLEKSLKSLIKKIQQEKELHSYLEDISPMNELSYPKEPEIKVSSSVSENLQPILTGVWKGSWKIFTGTIKRDGTLSLIQEGNKISAVMHVTYVKQGEFTAIQEIITGVVKEEDVILNAVSYTYLEKGNSINYNLDNFNLKISDDRSKLEGDFYNSKGGKGHAIFNKVNDEENDYQRNDDHD